MLALLKELFGFREKPDNEAAAKILKLESSVQSLTLDLSEKERQIQILREEIARIESKRESTIESVVSTHLESFIADVAPAIAQIVTQEHLLNVEAKPIQAKDITTVAMRLVRSLEEKGMKLDGAIGEQVAFDSNKHDLVSMGESATEEGANVTVRMPGVIYQGRILKKIAVLGALPTRL
ncbi:MAG: hypothetical protein K2X77_05840 [Candidatus Obscuribacterales bacterium]|jgi:molecular chaperone GrpE (heat shock protein)|nr:hypothetical protein [Candidatus Obscuribacterales bacterium]